MGSAKTNSANLVDLANRAGAELRRVGSQWRGRCPLHGGSNRTAFVVYNSAGKERWRCYSGDCGSGDAIDFVMKLHNVDYKSAVKILGITDVTRDSNIRAEQQERKTHNDVTIQKMRELKLDLVYHRALINNKEARELWRKRGINEYWQDFFVLGYKQMFRVKTHKRVYTTSSLAIPIYAPGRALVNIRHRLLDPPDGVGKYRPEMAGLQNAPFLANPDVGYEAGSILVVEGEIKAMVAYITLEEQNWQVIGIPGKSAVSRDLLELLNGKDVVIWLDPDATREAMELARGLHARYVQIAEKVDDAILKGWLSKKDMKSLIHNARVAI